MKTLAVIDTRQNTVYARQPWMHYKGTLEAVCEKAAPFVEKTLLLGPGGDIQADVDTSERELYKTLEQACKDFDSILYVYSDEPFLDVELTKKMLDNHRAYFADFSFAEGWPQGLAPMIVSVRILSDLADLCAQQPQKGRIQTDGRNFFFETIKKDLNRFSIETEISPVDVRALRIRLNYQNKNNSAICTKILNSGARTAYEILEKVQGHPDLLWGFPCFYNIQISNNCPQKCSYCPYASHQDFGNDTFMASEDFESILQKAADFSGEAVISLSYMGESALHPDFCRLMRMVIDNPDFFLHIETSGIGWSDEAWKTLLELDRRRISLIISLDSHKESVYRKVRGEGFEEAMNFARRALEEFKENTWIQCVRQKSLENELEPFYRHFQELQAQTIFQKYNNFCQTLPNEKSVDIAPLKRNICWALQREITVRTDGSVNLCACDLAGKMPLGNILKESMEDIWNKMNKYRLQHAQGQYPSACRDCDEYYIFNF